MKSWNGPETKGFELKFGGTKRGVPQNSGVVGQVFISEDGGFEAIITGYVIKNSLRSIAASFTVTPSSSLKSDLSEGLHPLVLAIGSALTLNHILMLGSLRDKILKNLTPKSVAKLILSNKKSQQILTSDAVDNTFWKKRLNNDFGNETVQNTITTGRKFYGMYCQKANESRTTARRNEPVRNENPLMIGGPRHPPRHPVHDPYGNRFPDPDTEYYNPLGGFLPPGVPRAGNPNIPDLFRGPDHPDLNPLGPLGQPRGGGSHGRPFMRDPNGRFGGNGGGGGFDGYI